MRHLTLEEIQEINASGEFDSWYQGIYKEATGVPDNMKDIAVYMRWNTGGVSGGSCWDSSDPQPYDGEGEPDFKVLDVVLAKLAPNITHLHYKEIERAVISTETTDYHYYGNYDDYEIKFISLPVLYNLLEKLGY